MPGTSLTARTTNLERPVHPPISRNEAEQPASRLLTTCKVCQLQHSSIHACATSCRLVNLQQFLCSSAVYSQGAPSGAHWRRVLQLSPVRTTPAVGMVDGKCLLQCMKHAQGTLHLRGIPEGTATLRLSPTLLQPSKGGWPHWWRPNRCSHRRPPAGWDASTCRKPGRATWQLVAIHHSCCRQVARRTAPLSTTPPLSQAAVAARDCRGAQSCRS